MSSFCVTAQPIECQVPMTSRIITMTCPSPEAKNPSWIRQSSAVPRYWVATLCGAGRGPALSTNVRRAARAQLHLGRIPYVVGRGRGHALVTNAAEHPGTAYHRPTKRIRVCAGGILGSFLAFRGYSAGGRKTTPENQW